VVIPVHDDNPTRRTPVVTLVLIAVNVVVFLLSPAATHLLGDSAAKQQCRQRAFFDQWAAEPRELLSNRADDEAVTDQVVRSGGRVGCLVVEPAPYDKRPFLSALTAMFLHGGWLHLLGNMLFLWVFGNNVEDRLRKIPFLGFYLLCGYAATYGFAVFEHGSSTPLVGASGAVAGVLGAYLVLFPRARVLSLLTFFFFLPVRLPAWVVLGSWFLLQYFYFRGAGLAEGSGVAYGAHVIGFLAGALLVWASREKPRDKRLRSP